MGPLALSIGCGFCRGRGRDEIVVSWKGIRTWKIEAVGGDGVILTIHRDLLMPFRVALSESVFHTNVLSRLPQPQPRPVPRNLRTLRVAACAWALISALVAHLAIGAFEHVFVAISALTLLVGPGGLVRLTLDSEQRSAIEMREAAKEANLLAFVLFFLFWVIAGMVWISIFLLRWKAMGALD
jgi:hypothetical protein